MEAKYKNIITKIVNVILIIGITLIAWNIWTNSQMESPVTIGQAIEIGKAELKQHGYPVEDMNVEADEDNSFWQESMAKDPSKMQKPIVRKLNLEEKKYWAIYYTPKINQLGEDAWVFIDINSGEVIGIIWGE